MQEGFVIKKAAVCIIVFLYASSIFAADIDLTVQSSSIVESQNIISTNSIEQDVQIFHREDGFTHFECENCQYLNRPGQPAIPWKVVDILLPPQADLSSITAYIREVSFEEVNGKYDIEPTPAFATCIDGQLVQSWPDDLSIVDGKDIDIYDVNDYWPPVEAKILTTGKLRRYKLVKVAIPLVRFNPIQQKIIKLREADIKVSFDYLPNDKLGILSTTAARPDHIGRKKVKDLAVNFEQAVDSYDSLEQSRSGLLLVEGESLPGYVIITTESVENNSNKLADFIAHKEALGFDVSVITETDFGGGTGDNAAENVRNWLINNYESYNIEYVLLIGNPTPSWDGVPMKKLYPRLGEGSDESAPSDLYYADLTGNWDLDGDGYYGEWDGDFGTGGVDRYWEVIVGRIPLYSVAWLDGILEKTINYENAYGADEQWRKNVLLPMNPLDTDHQSFRFGEQIKDSICFPNKWSYHRLYDDDYAVYPPPETIPCTYENTLDVWTHNRFGLVVWCAHGTRSYSSDVIDVSDVPDLNDAYPSFTYQGSCNNSEPEYFDNLSFELLKNGCVSTVGATRASWYEYRWQQDNQEIDTIGYEYTEGLISRKLSCGESLQELKQIYEPYENEGWMNFLVFNIYGDPSLKIIRSEDEPHIPITYYVDANSLSIEPNGLSWENAFYDLQDALEVAWDGDIIYVAEGVYTPTEPNGNRDIPFHIPCGVSLYGGFPSGGGDFNDRDPNLCLTILSGDLNRNDINDFEDPSRSDNSYQVVYGSCDFSIDGFVIASSYSDQVGPYTDMGGGMGLSHSNAVVRNCVFTSNYAEIGGGVSSQFFSSSEFLNCQFFSNRATYSGGGIHQLFSYVKIRNCDFLNNLCDEGGGAIVLNCSTGEISDCNFIGNSCVDHWGGAMLCAFDIHLDMENCSFYDNYSDTHSGALDLSDVEGSIRNCEFINNTAGQKGGCSRCQDLNLDISNCTFINNTAENGGVIYNDSIYGANFYNCTFYDNTASLQGDVFYVKGKVYLTNCIFWGNDPNEFFLYNIHAHAYLNYCCIEGGWSGDGDNNIEADPLFVDPNNGDFHLKSQAGRWNPNSQTWVTDGITSPCIDTGDPASDWRSEVWPHGKCINMGLYGGTAEASMSLSNAGNIADLNNDDRVDFLDVCLLGNEWCEEQLLLKEDMNRNGLVDPNDISIFTQNWLWSE